MSEEAKEQSWIPILVFWLGVGLYQIPVGDLYRDRFRVRPAIAEAAELKARGGADVSEQILLEQVPDNPRNARLLYALANFYEHTDRPVLAALYFHAFEHSGRKHDAGPEAVEESRRWLSDNPATRQLTLDIARVEKELSAFERDRRRGLVEHPADLQPVLSVPAANPTVGAGYIPPEHPAACGPDRPRCGYGFDARSGRLWESLPALKLRFRDERAGPRCCELSLEDPDLRALDAAEADFMLNPDLMDGSLASDTEAGRQVRLAFASRVLLKHKLVLDFIEQADHSLPPKPWTAWSWVLLVGWIIGAFLVASWIEDLVSGIRNRRRLRNEASAQASAGGRDPADVPALATPARDRGRASWPRRVGFGLLGLLCLLQAADNFANSNRQEVYTTYSPNSATPAISTPRLNSRPWAGNSIHLAAGVTMSLVAVLAFNRGWAPGGGAPGPADRLLGRLFGAKARRARVLAVSCVVLSALVAGTVLVRVRYHFDAKEATAAFQQSAWPTSVRINDRFAYAPDREGGRIHVAAFGPALVREFERARLGFGYEMPRFEFPVPGVLPLLMLALLATLAAARRGLRTPSLALIALVTQAYLLFWLTSAQKRVFYIAGVFDEWWLAAAVPLVLGQCLLLAAIHARLRPGAEVGVAPAGWLSLYFLASIAMLLAAYAVSGAPWLAPATPWLALYVLLLSAFWCLLLQRRLPEAQS